MVAVVVERGRTAGLLDEVGPVAELVERPVLLEVGVVERAAVPRAAFHLRQAVQAVVLVGLILVITAVDGRFDIAEQTVARVVVAVPEDIGVGDWRAAVRADPELPPHPAETVVAAIARLVDLSGPRNHPDTFVWLASQSQSSPLALCDIKGFVRLSTNLCDATVSFRLRI